MCAWCRGLFLLLLSGGRGEAPVLVSTLTPETMESFEAQKGYHLQLLEDQHDEGRKSVEAAVGPVHGYEMVCTDQIVFNHLVAEVPGLSALYKHLVAKPGPNHLAHSGERFVH